MDHVAAWRERLLDGPEALSLAPTERALLEALLERPGLALGIYTLIDAVWTRRNLNAPLTADLMLRVRIHRLRRKLADAGLNPEALVNDPPMAYGLNLDTLETPPVRRPRYSVTL